MEILYLPNLMNIIKLYNCVKIRYFIYCLLIYLPVITNTIVTKNTEISSVGCDFMVYQLV